MVGNEATVLGFVGCPYTLATYMVEVSVHVVQLPWSHVRHGKWQLSLLRGSRAPLSFLAFPCPTHKGSETPVSLLVLQRMGAKSQESKERIHGREYTVPSVVHEMSGQP